MWDQVIFSSRLLGPIWTELKRWGILLNLMNLHALTPLSKFPKSCWRLLEIAWIELGGLNSTHHESISSFMMASTPKPAYANPTSYRGALNASRVIVFARFASRGLMFADQCRICHEKCRGGGSSGQVGGQLMMRKSNEMLRLSIGPLKLMA